MAFELFVSRQSKRPLDMEAAQVIENKLREQAPKSKFKVRWGWSEDARICEVKTTLVGWRIVLQDGAEDMLNIYADIPKFVGIMANEEKKNGVRNTLNGILDELGF